MALIREQDVSVGECLCRQHRRSVSPAAPSMPPNRGRRPPLPEAAAAAAAASDASPGTFKVGRCNFTHHYSCLALPLPSSEACRLWLLSQGQAARAAIQAFGRTTPLSTAKATAAQQQQHQRNTMTKYFPVLQDGTGSRGSEQLQPGQPSRDRAEASCMPRLAEAACQTDADESAAALAQAQALQAELDQLRKEADQLRCFQSLNLLVQHVQPAVLCLCAWVVGREPRACCSKTLTHMSICYMVWRAIQNPVIKGDMCE